MPIAAKFSKTLYDRLGHDVAGEMVDWFNRMDASYRADLREFNEHNFARFNATLAQHIAELRSELAQQGSALRAELSQRLAESELKQATAFSGLEVRIERRLGEQSRWLVGIWITVIIAAVGVWLRSR